MKNRLKTLEEHNNRKIYELGSVGSIFNLSPVKNGIACPNCGEELVDVNPNEVLTSNPPKKFIKCQNEKCSYAGYRLA
jgi:uncharacterized protein with PIN domain